VTPQFEVCTISIIDDTFVSVNDVTRSLIDNYKVTLQIVASLMIVIYDCKMFIVEEDF